jgi:hypothetical protein
MNTKISIKSLFGLGLIAALGFVSGCTTGPEIKYEADATANLTGYKTYILVPFSKPSGTGITGANPGAGLRYAPVLTSSIKSTLAAKGYTEAPKETADFAVNVRATVVPKTDITDWGMGYGGYGYGGWGRGGYWGHGGMGYDVTVDQYNEGVLRIEIYDVKKRELVWVGWATAELYKAPEDAGVAKAVTDILANFPVPAPKKK